MTATGKIYRIGIHLHNLGTCKQLVTNPALLAAATIQTITNRTDDRNAGS